MQVRAFVFVLSTFAISSTLLAQQSPPRSFPNQPVDSGMSLAPNMDNMADMSTGSISGSLLNTDGRPVGNCSIELHELNSGSLIASTYAMINGSFQFDNVPTGRYEVVAIHGVDSAYGRVRVNQGPSEVTLRINVPQADPGAGDTISVKALQVPGKAQNEFRKATKDFIKKRYNDAENHAAKALSIVPDYAQALTLRGLLKVAKNDVQGGQQDFQKAISSDPNYGLSYFAMGATLNDAGQYAQAQLTLEEGLRIEPTSWQGYFELSKSVMGQHDFRSALKYVVKAESFGADYAPIHLVKAHALLGLKDYGEAATELERYLGVDSTGSGADEARRTLKKIQAFSATAQN